MPMSASVMWSQNGEHTSVVSYRTYIVTLDTAKSIHPTYTANCLVKFYLNNMLNIHTVGLTPHIRPMPSYTQCRLYQHWGPDGHSQPKEAPR